MNEARFTEPTYAQFLDLWSNYQTSIGVAEICDTTCLSEQQAYLNTIMATGPMTAVHSFLISKGTPSYTIV